MVVLKNTCFWEVRELSSLFFIYFFEKNQLFLKVVKIKITNSKEKINGFIILPNEKEFPNRERPTIKGNLLQKDYHRSRTFIGILFIKWQLKIHKNKTKKTQVFVNNNNFFCKIFPTYKVPVRPLTKSMKKGWDLIEGICLYMFF